MTDVEIELAKLDVRVAALEKRAEEDRVNIYNEIAGINQKLDTLSRQMNKASGMALLIITLAGIAGATGSIFRNIISKFF